MAEDKIPIDEIIKQAEKMPDVIKGTSCNQTSFKVGKKAFLYIGIGPKGIGFKALFKLNQSKEQATKLSRQNPDRFEVGSTGWITTRFTKEDSLPRSLWTKWLKESYQTTLSK